MTPTNKHFTKECVASNPSQATASHLSREAWNPFRAHQVSRWSISVIGDVFTLMLLPDRDGMWPRTPNSFSFHSSEACVPPSYHFIYTGEFVKKRNTKHVDKMMLSCVHDFFSFLILYSGSIKILQEANSMSKDGVSVPALKK